MLLLLIGVCDPKSSKVNQTKFRLLSVVANKVLWEHSHAHSFL